MASTRPGRLALAFAVSVLAALLGASSLLLGVCGPFTDVAADAFCPFVLEIFYLGITTGTTPTTFDPTSAVTRLQMAAFLSRTVDRTLLRGSRRAALDQFWTTQNATVLGLTTVGGNPSLLASDGADIWVANNGGTVSRVRASDGRLLETWTGAAGAVGVVVAAGRVVVSGSLGPGRLYAINPAQPAGAVTVVATNLGEFPNGIAFDGASVWAANVGPPGSVSKITPAAAPPWTVTTVTAGFSHPEGALYDGTNVWVTDHGAATLLKLDSSGGILQTVTLGGQVTLPSYDGTNIWVPNATLNAVSVVRASNGVVLQTLTGNGVTGPNAAAFDGQRVLVLNYSNDTVSLWKAADLTPLGSFATPIGGSPYGACSDGVNFWITLNTGAALARF